jgi:hypothetical protein
MRFVPVLMMLLGATLALAQDPAPPSPPSPPAAPAAAGADLQQGAAGDEEDPANSVPQSKYLETAQLALDSMKADLSRGLDQLRQAREKKDAVMLTYVNEQVTAMKGILRVSEDAFVSLQEALAANDTERARFEFRKIEVSKHKMDDLLQAALNAAGAEATESNTSVQMEVDPSLTTVDPYYGDPSFFFDPSTQLQTGSTGGLPPDDPARPIPASTVI